MEITIKGEPEEIMAFIASRLSKILTDAYKSEQLPQSSVQQTDQVIEIHITGITAKQLAEAAGWNPKYLSAVLNGHRTPKTAEQTLRRALNTLLAAQHT